MDADIWLDETYRSGLAGSPGARFVFRLNTGPLASVENLSEGLATQEPNLETQGLTTHELPSKLSVLFVDDDLVLRKMFIRALKRVAPDWDIREASNGETALQIVESHTFNIIFMDQVRSPRSNNGFSPPF